VDRNFVLILAGICIGVALIISLAKIKPWWGKIYVIAAFALIPAIYAVYALIKLEKLCKDEGGLKIYRTVQGVDGFYSPFADESVLTKYDFAFVESGLSPGTYVRFSRSPKGGIVKENIESLKSRYIYRVVRYKEVRGYLGDTYMKDASQMIVRGTNEVLSEYTNFNFAVSWLERLGVNIVVGRGNGGICNLESPQQIQEQLIASTLKPAQ
jgi:hypothetical protein